jgi:Associated with zinc fingers
VHSYCFASRRTASPATAANISDDSGAYLVDIQLVNHSALATSRQLDDKITSSSKNSESTWDPGTTDPGKSFISILRGRSETHPGQTHAASPKAPPLPLSNCKTVPQKANSATVGPKRPFHPTTSPVSKPNISLLERLQAANTMGRSSIAKRKSAVLSPTEAPLKKQISEQVKTSTQETTAQSPTTMQSSESIFSSSSSDNMDLETGQDLKRSSSVKSDESMSDAQESIPEPLPKIPPIFVESSDWRKVAKKLMAIFPKDGLTAKTHTGSGLKIQCIDISGFRIIQRYLSQQSINFHTLPLPEERILKVIIKGLPVDITEDEISEELRSLDYDVKAVRQFKNATKKFPIHLISLSSTPENKQIFNETSLFFIQIKIESYRSNKPAQCFSCQRFGHSSLHCGYTPRCVKCTGSHLAKDCSKPRDEDPKCVNCDGSHPANYTKCPALIAEKERRLPLRPNTVFKNSSKDFPQSLSIQTPNLPTTQISTTQPSYSAITTNSSSSQANLSKDLPAIISQLSSLITNLSTGKTNVKDALLIILQILPLLLSSNA